MKKKGAFINFRKVWPGSTASLVEFEGRSSSSKISTLSLPCGDGASLEGVGTGLNSGKVLFRSDNFVFRVFTWLLKFLYAWKS